MTLEILYLLYIENLIIEKQMIITRGLGSGFNQVSGSEIRIRYTDPDSGGQKWPTKVEKTKIFHVLKGYVLFWDLKASFEPGSGLDPDPDWIRIGI
jgi:hypothetical protein